MRDYNQSYVLIITGPTACGKTALSLAIAKHVGAEIINADIGGFYTPLTIGTAKPKWKESAAPHHLFDIMSEPKNFTVMAYRREVTRLVEEITSRGNLPIIVGGSLFYLKSLFFPPPPLPQLSGKKEPLFLEASVDEPEYVWKKLAAIDPQRAKELHPHDTYRILRALEIWEQTGQKPSTYKPVFNPPFHALFVYLDLPTEVLARHIEWRIEEMFHPQDDEGGWIAEVKEILGTPWEEFVRKKGFIGYAEIIDWIKKGAPNEELAALKAHIIQETKAYARKQQIFWKSFQGALTKNRNNSPFHYSIKIFHSGDTSTISAIMDTIEKDQKLITKLR